MNSLLTLSLQSIKTVFSLSQLLQGCGLADLADDVVKHFKDKMAPSIRSLQQAASNKAKPTVATRASHSDVVIGCIQQLCTLARELPETSQVITIYIV